MGAFALGCSACLTGPRLPLAAGPWRCQLLSKVAGLLTGMLVNPISFQWAFKG